MSSHRFRNVIVCLAFAGSFVSAQPVPPSPLEAETFFDVWILDRLSIGLSLSHSKLSDNKRPKDEPNLQTFVGYVWKLEDVDPYSLDPVISYWTAPYLRISLFRSSISGRTRNYNLGKHSDGIVSVEGPALMFEALWPMCDETVFLHAGAGLLYGFGDFDAEHWWSLGYLSYKAWVAADKTETPILDRYRQIHVNDAWGYVLGFGVSWRPVLQGEIDLSIRKTWIDPDCEFGYQYPTYWFKRHDGDFELNNLSLVLSASFVF